jgi:radical SAM protein with 4Fe4S-binding SPASM domain
MYISAWDSARLASKVTAKRLTNAWAVWRSYERSRRTGVPMMTGLPISLSVEPTTACNLRCPECPSGLRSFTRPTGKLERPLFDDLLNEVHEQLFYLIFYFQGEPYLHPDFLTMVDTASRKNIYTATSTNAHFLDDERARATVESGLDRLIISIDGTDQSTYEAYRKTGTLEKVLEGTENIIYWRNKLKRKSPAVVWQFLVVGPNEHQIPEVLRLGKKYGVDKVALKSAQIYDYEFGNELIPVQEKYSRYKKLADGRFEIKHSLDNECWKMWHSCVITWDGRVVPCCFDKDAYYSMGRFGEQNFTTIWNSDKYNQFRQQLLKGRSEIDMCRNCTEGASVWK